MRRVESSIHLSPHPCHKLLNISQVVTLFFDGLGLGDDKQLAHQLARFKEATIGSIE
jgi:hypothetical protein